MKKNKNAAPLVGRKRESTEIRACLKAERNVLLEGPVGVGKTHLALSVAHELKRPVFRVDGDSRYTEQKLSGWFDPTTVLKKGYGKAAFQPGPLVEAMQKGGVLFINELNRMPEGVQNILLPAIDERVIMVPRLGEIRAKPGFLVIATQNPKEFVATSHLSEAILDRFELVVLDYQSESDELSIVSQAMGAMSATDKVLAAAAVRLARLTRTHPQVRRGASVRAAQSVAEIASVLISDGMALEQAFLTAVLVALPTRIEIEQEAEAQALLREWAAEALDSSAGKKKS